MQSFIEMPFYFEIHATHFFFALQLANFQNCRHRFKKPFSFLVQAKRKQNENKKCDAASGNRSGNMLHSNKIKKKHTHTPAAQNDSLILWPSDRHT